LGHHGGKLGNGLSGDGFGTINSDDVRITKNNITVKWQGSWEENKGRFGKE
jgi:hypothetical protein